VLKIPFEIEGHTSGSRQHRHQRLSGSRQRRRATFAASRLRHVRAKKSGKDRAVAVCDDLGNAARERLTWKASCGARSKAAKSPCITSRNSTWTPIHRSLRGSGALVSPKPGTIPPLTFIPIAEETGLIVPLGAYVMERACADAVIWQRRMKRPIQVAVNVSSVQFARDSFIEEVEVSCAAPTEASLLQLELTDPHPDRRRAHRRNDAASEEQGISVAMDDFGRILLPELFAEALLRCAEARSVLVNEWCASGNPRFVHHSADGHNLHMKVIVEESRPRNSVS